MTRRRLDAELVRRGLAASRAEAQEAVRRGLVRVGGAPAPKPSSLVAPEQSIELVGPPRPFASRGGEKLDAALARFRIDPAGRECLDLGASTGGFTDRLLRGGAARVTAVDVGYGQLAWHLRTDPRVVVLERTNARTLVPEQLPARPDLVVADLSFISLTLVAPAIARVAAPGADVVALVKPQFEVGRGEVERGGVVRSPAAWRRAIERVAEAFTAAGLGPVAVMASPVRGPAGNVEFFLHAIRGAPARELDLEGALAEAGSLAGGRR
ncbi:MAG: 16S/23S rRNA (cytidine-2'-O)-methyltransferase TlyA [Actinomycetota bacterium]|nr:MAG: 16S/23S rRNA (cytidine-2'-O)-methyltransferase TlyA [Actinomycetota bacterium]